jgi:hypothetical protein
MGTSSPFGRPGSVRNETSSKTPNKGTNRTTGDPSKTGQRLP